MEVFNAINLEAKEQNKGILLISGHYKLIYLKIMGMRKETSSCESLDILIVSIKLHMIINMVCKHTHLHIQWVVIECQTQ